MMQHYKTTGQQGLFGEEKTLKKLSQQGDPLERLQKVIDWAIFTPILRKTLNTTKKSCSGTRPYPLVLMRTCEILHKLELLLLTPR